MKVALITGGARRIGSEITRTLMEAGWYVIVHCNRSVDEANALISSGNGAVISVDLGEEDAAEKLSEMVRDDAMVKERGGLDLMIHNASIYREMPFEKVDAKTFAEYSKIHVEIPFFLTQFLLEELKTVNGNVIGIIDTSWNHAWKHLTHYTMTKAALRQMIVNLAGELAPEIRVNGIAPGAIMAADWEQEKFDDIVANLPLQRAGNPSDIAQAVLFLLEATYITGYILPVDGGWSIT